MKMKKRMGRRPCNRAVLKLLSSEEHRLVYCTKAYGLRQDPGVDTMVSLPKSLAGSHIYHGKSTFLAHRLVAVGI